MLARLIGRLVALRAAIRAAGRAPHEEAPAPAPQPDEDPSERRVPSSRRAETLVAALLLLAAVFGFGFTAVYAADGGNTQLLGIAIGGALAMLAAAAIVAGKFVVPQETAVEQRDVLLDEEQTEEVVELIEAGGEGISRRVLLTGASGIAGAAIVTAAATPLASLGPRLTSIHSTPWRRGIGLVDDQGRAYAADDIQIGAFYTALPQGGDNEAFGAGVLLVKLPEHLIHLPESRQGWAPRGILAYSKICTHAGCAVSLYRYPTFAPTSAEPAFTCPCHYSTFSAGDGGKVLFGPAGRPLPQLPLLIDSEGLLRAAGGFDEDIGPSWFDIHRA
jgi:ubiquinol-cytochrome c reductase iron-sulfur subunit